MTYKAHPFELLNTTFFLPKLKQMNFQQQLLIKTVSKQSGFNLFVFLEVTSKSDVQKLDSIYVTS